MNRFKLLVLSPNFLLVHNSSHILYRRRRMSLYINVSNMILEVAPGWIKVRVDF